MEITLQSDVYRKRRKVVTIISVIMCIICLPSGMLSFMLGRAEMGSTFYDSLGNFSIFCMRREKVRRKHDLRDLRNAQKALVSGHRKYIFSEESTSIKSEIAEGVNLWTAYRDWGFYENYIYIRNLSNQVILVDRVSCQQKTMHGWWIC